MPSQTNLIRSPKPMKRRVLFELQAELLNQIRQVADANEISVSHFLRESVRRNLKAYEKAS